MKTFAVILALIIVAVITIYFAKGCNVSYPKSEIAKENDILKDKLNTITIEGEARHKLDSGLNHDLTVALDTTNKALTIANKKLAVRDKQIFAANKELHAALIVHDTPAVYKNAEYMAFQIDSMGTEKWNVDRELDRQIVLNEQLRLADSTALANCRGDLKHTREAASAYMSNVEIQHQQDQAALKKAKRGRGLWAVIGGAIGVAIKSIF